jgi:hypothetical protein
VGFGCFAGGRREGEFDIRNTNYRSDHDNRFYIAWTEEARRDPRSGGHRSQDDGADVA